MSASAYDQLAEEYAARAEKHKLSAYPAIDDLLLPLMMPNSVFLDVGCGNGVSTEYVAMQGHHALGIDISRKMIEVCKRDREHGEFWCSDYRGIFFRDDSIDAILAFAFIHCFPKPDARFILWKMRRELRPGGLLYMGTTTHDTPSDGMEPKEDYPGAPERWRARYTEAELDWLFRYCGFEIIDSAKHPDEFGKVWHNTIMRKPE